MERNETNESPHLGDLDAISRATMHNIPPLALPMSETQTEFLQVSRMPSSHRIQPNPMSYSHNSMAKII